MSYLFTLFPEKMCKVMIAAEKSLKTAIINTLYDLKVLHIEEQDVQDFLSSAKVDKDLGLFSDMLVNLESALNEIKAFGYDFNEENGENVMLNEKKVLNYEKYVE